VFDLKPLSTAAIPRALEKAERYRLLNLPWAAESICLDILRADPGHQRALRTLLLSRVDQFGADSGRFVKLAREALELLSSDYERAYYAGIICERLAKAQMDNPAPRPGIAADDWMREAMGFYERAEKLRPAGNDDAILRWNSCARLLDGSAHGAPE
jgi:hypothetical protein